MMETGTLLRTNALLTIPFRCGVQQ